MVINEHDNVEESMTDSDQLQSCGVLHKDADTVLHKCCTALQLVYSSTREARDESGLRILPRIIESCVEKDIEIITSCMAAMASVTARSEADTRIMGGHGIKAIVAAMKAHEKQQDVQMNGLATLAGMLSSSPANCALLLQHEGLEAIKRSMHANSRNDTLQLVASRLLDTVASDGDVHMHEALVTSGCARAIANAMLAAISGGANEHSLTVASTVLAKIVSEELTYDTKALALSHGIGEAFIRAATACGQSQVVHMLAGEMLLKLLRCHPDNIKASACAAIPVLARNMMLYARKPAVSAQSCEALMAIFEEARSFPDRTRSQYQEVFGESDGIRAVALYLNGCEDCYYSRAHQNFSSEDSWAQAVVSACKVLCYATHSRNQSRCAQAGAIGTVLRMMTAHKDVHQVYEWACAAVCCITIGHKSNVDALTRLNGKYHASEAYQIALERGSQSLQASAAALLAAMAPSSAN